MIKQTTLLRFSHYSRFARSFAGYLFFSITLVNSLLVLITFVINVHRSNIEYMTEVMRSQGHGYSTRIIHENGLIVTSYQFILTTSQL